MHLLRVEGVNFDVTLFDTQDISTIRGAGLALLVAAEHVEASLKRSPVAELQQIFAGASQAAFSFWASSDDATAALETVRAVLNGQPTEASGMPNAPLQHLIFMADIVELPDRSPDAVERALRAAEAMNRGRQFREYTVKLPDPRSNSRGPDPYNHIVQALATFTMQDGRRSIVSPSVIDRHKYGRGQRSKFYDRAGGALEVTSNLRDMVDAPLIKLPPSTAGKLAYLYADGNKFSAIRGKVGTAAFAAEIEVRFKTLLNRIASWWRDGLANHDRYRVVIKDGSEQARFETLLWGGDEFLFVMPAWLGLHFLGEVAAATKGWKVVDEGVTFAFGLAICDVKTPVRQAYHTAKLLAESVKTAMGKEPRAGAAIQVYESQSLIDAPLATQRGLLFGIPPTTAKDLDIALTIAGDALPTLTETIRGLTDEGAEYGAFSGALLHAAIRQARNAPGGLRGPESEPAARALLDEAFGRFGKTVPAIEIPGFVSRGLVLDLCLIAMLRDYCVRSDGEDLPPFPGAAP